MIEDTQPYAATWCPVCDKRVSDKPRDTCQLLTHVRKFHPKISRQDFEYQEEEDSERISKHEILSTSSSGLISNNNIKPEQRKVYATRVDTWKSHTEKKLCPKCQREGVPTLHTRGDKLTTSHIGALCLLGCWPFCFIPLMMKRAKRVRMICPFCGYVYGSFHYKNSGLTTCKTDSENSQARLSSPPTSFRIQPPDDESTD